MPKKIFIVSIWEDVFGSFAENTQFTTFDKSIAKNWVKKFNRIIEENKERISNTENEVFWCYYASYPYPKASCYELEIRVDTEIILKGPKACIK